MSPNTAFRFQAIRPDGTRESGVVEAPSREAALALVGGRGAFATALSPATRAGTRRARISPEDLALGLRGLATLLGAGIPIARALVVLDDLVPPAWLAALPDLRRRVEQGEHLGDALEASSLPLPQHICGLIRAGEAGSGLAAAVEAAARLLEEGVATRAALRNALAYPTMLLIAGSASIALLAGVVLPRFASLLQEFGESLPLSTRLVLQAAAWARYCLLPGTACLLAGLLLWRKWVTTPQGLIRWHQFKLAIPVGGPIFCSRGTANVCSALAALLEAGVPLATALPHAARAAGDLAMGGRLLAARRRIGMGAGIAAALKAEDALTPTAQRLVRIGEETGELAAMLAHAARIEAAEARHRLQRLIRILEPALILLFGGVVMVVAAALLQAMYGLRPAG